MPSPLSCILVHSISSFKLLRIGELPFHPASIAAGASALLGGAGSWQPCFCGAALRHVERKALLEVGAEPVTQSSRSAIH